MAILIKGRTKKEAAEDLRRAARDIERNAEDIVGEIEGVRSIKVLITMEPGELLQYKTFKEKMVSSMTEDIVKGVEEIRQHEAGEIKLLVDEIEDFGLHSSSFAIDTPEDAERLVDVTTDEAVQEVAEIIATGEYLYGLNDDNLADLVIQTNEVQNYIVESFTALRQYQKPTDEAVRDCSTCIGCECEPELGETVKNCKCYIKREPTDEAVQRAIEWAEQERKNNFRYMNFGDADSAAIAIQALRQYQKPTDEVVRSAIGWLEAEKIDRQREWEKQDTEWKLEPGAKEMHDSFMSAFDLAITALRQMRTEPCRCTEICGICNNPNYHIHSSIWWKSASTEYGRENREIPTRHCPNCGKLVKHDG